jgi:amino acid adenylation domain-containing protein
MKKQAPLSYSQESLWFLQQLDPDSNGYNSNLLFKFTGGIDRLAMETALNQLVRRHEPLRTIYPSRAGRPVQVIQPFESIPLQYLDYSGLTEDERQQKLHRYVTEHGNRPYDLQHGPLVRFALLHTASNEDYLFFSIHHIGFDGWSQNVFIDELLQLYRTCLSGETAGLPELPIQYADYAIWQKDWLSGDTLKAFVDHWKNIYSGELPILDLPTDHPRPALQTYHGARFHLGIQPAISARIREFCQKERLTPFHFFMTAYAVLLMRYTGQEDIIMGCPFANRTISELDGLVGLFVNTLPIRVNLQGNPSVRELLNQVRTVMLDAFTWQAAPFEVLVSEISPERDLSRTPVFQVAINLRHIPRPSQSIIAGLKMERIRIDNATAPFDLSLDIDDKAGLLDVSLRYNHDLYDENTIIHMAAHYQNLLGQLLVKTDCPIAELEMLTPSEWNRIVVDWNDTGTDFPQVCVHDLVAGQAKKSPDAVAVVCNDNSLTYADLEKRVNQLAHYLRKKGVEAESRVCIYLPRSEKSIISMLAILKAGGAYVPLDLTYPAERISYMVKDSDPAAIITLSHLKPQLPEQFQEICLDTEADSIDACETEAPVSITDNDSLAYVIYTSGSTGHPKGAMNIHKGIVNYLAHMVQQLQFKVSDRVVQFTSLSFDMSIIEIFGTLSCGGTIFLMDDSQMRDPDYINAAIIDRQATLFKSVPTMLRALCESALAGERKKNSLRLIFIGGEILRDTDVELARRAFGESIKLVNGYGPTECSVAPTNYPIPPTLPNGLRVIPIGKPISNMRTYVLDKYFHPVPAGVKGELFIGGIGVGRGYWNRPDLTADRFLADPFWPGDRMYRTGDIVRQLPDGTLCFFGRSDNQVKIRGYRVELGEIETVVNEFPGVKETAVVLWRQDGSESLVAYITVREGDEKKLKEDLHAFLVDRLPFYMMPSVIMVLEEMPLTLNRKIDRRALPLPEIGKGPDQYLAPRNDTEKRLVLIWQEVLGTKRVGIRDNFFELGGHSLLAVRLLARIQDEFGQSLPLSLLFRGSTVEALASCLTGKVETSSPNGIVPIQLGENNVPLFILNAGFYMQKLAFSMGTAHPIYGLDPKEGGQNVFRGSVQETAKIYYRCLIDFYPQGPYLLLGHSANGFFALELSRLLQKNGKEVSFLGLLDTYPPGHLRSANLRDRIKIHLDNLQDKNISGVLEYAQRSMRRFTARWWRAAAGPERLIKHYEQKGQPEDVKSLLINAYKPEPYQGQVTLFTATHRHWYVRWDPMEKWAGILSGPVEIIPIPGTHMSIFDQPHVNILAGKILDSLNRVETTTNGNVK